MTDKVAKKMSESQLNPDRSRGKDRKASTPSTKRQSKSREQSRGSSRSTRRSSGI